MARKLATPIRPPNAPGDTVEQNIPRLRIDMGYVPGDEKSDLDFTKTAITYDVAFVDNTYTARRIKKSTVYHADWPPEVVEAVRALVQWAEDTAVAEGVIGKSQTVRDL